MEETLRDSEETLKQAQHLAKVGSWTWNLKDNSFVLSDEMSHLYGIDKREFSNIEDILNKIIHPDDREMIFEASGKVFTEGYGPPLVYRAIRPDGELRWMSATIPEVRHSDVDGNPEVMVGTVQDITEHKQAQEIIRESEEKLRILFNNVGVGITVVGVEGNIMDANDTVLKMKGYNREDVIGHFGLDFVAEKDRARATQDMMDFLMTQEERTPMREYTLLAKDGSEIPCEANSTLLHDSSGNLVGFISVERDITERKQAEDKLQESEETLRSVITSMDDLVFTIDIDGKFQGFYQPDRTDELYMPPEQFLGRHYKDVLPPHITKELQHAIKNIMKSGGIEQFDYWIELKGKIFWYNVSLSSMKDSSDEIVGFTSVTRNITKRKQAEVELQYYSERIRAMAKQLSEVEESQRQLTARELHDNIGQNLTALGINLSMLKMKLEEARMEEEQNILNDSQLLIEQTTESIRDVMANLRPPVLEDYGILSTLKWYGERFSSRTGIALTVQGEEPDPRLNADIEITLFRIYQEALTNISKHAKASNVIVSFNREDGRQRLVIADDGIGFDISELSKYTKQSSWGLLTMSERAHSINSSFLIDSKPGTGTRVIIEI